MGIFSFFNFFKRKPKTEEGEKIDYSVLGLSRPVGPETPPPAELFPSQLPPPSPLRTGGGPVTSEFATQENMKAKLDLVSTQIDSMRIQQESINEKILQIEKMVKQLLDISKRF